LPVAVPGAAVSPGTSNWSLANVPAATVIEELVLLVMPGLDVSEAVTVVLPPLLRVTLKVWLPLVSAASAGKVALASVEVRWTVSLVLMRFQLVSTALTVKLKAVPAVCVLGVPSFPVLEPGAAVSPGASTCSLANAPGFTVVVGFVFAVMPECVESDAVTVAVPAVLKERLKALVPLTRAALAGRTALASLAVMARVSFVLIRFQLASTALTVSVNGVPAV